MSKKSRFNKALTALGGFQPGDKVLYVICDACRAKEDMDDFWVSKDRNMRLTITSYNTSLVHALVTDLEGVNFFEIRHCNLQIITDEK